MKISEDITLKQLLYGDFDKDGIKNIDDLKPAHKGGNYPDVTNDKYYSDVRYGSNETKLSDQLIALEKHIAKYKELLQKVKRENPNSYGRLKTIASTIKKLQERYLVQLNDVAGATVVTKDRVEAKKKLDEIKRKYKHEKVDDYYKKPLNGVYYAYHVPLLIKGKKIELQIKSKPMMELQKKMHKDYKNRKPLSSYKTKAKSLFFKGY